jgi:uncharacterized membrane protein
MRARTTSYLPIAAALGAIGLALLGQYRSNTRRRAQVYLDSIADAALRDVNLHVPLGSAVLGLAAVAGGAYLLSKELRSGPADSDSNSNSNSVHEAIELNVPVSTAYNQWTQFEEFPKFMASVESVRQVDDTHLHWRANVGGKTKEWDAEITEQIPDERIAWRSTSGVTNAGVVTFHKIGDNRTRVMLQMDYEPETAVEKIGDAGGAVKLTTKGNLKRFKKLLEDRGHETGAWRGEVTQH